MYRRTDGRTFETGFIRSTLSKSRRPKNGGGELYEYADLCLSGRRWHPYRFQCQNSPASHQAPWHVETPATVQSLSQIHTHTCTWSHVHESSGQFPSDPGLVSWPSNLRQGPHVTPSTSSLQHQYPQNYPTSTACCELDFWPLESNHVISMG